jgi:asparagine synthase (glutamine-hydrolysing)
MKGILPELVRNRKDKIGFIAPEERWFKYDHAHEYVEWLKSLLPYSKGIINERYAVAYFKDVQQGKIKFDYTYWHILLFCLWMKVFKVELE